MQLKMTFLGLVFSFVFFACSASMNLDQEPDRNQSFLTIPQYARQQFARERRQAREKMLGFCPTDESEAVERSTTNPKPSGGGTTTTTQNIALDVGKVTIESVSDTCNGVMLEPTIVLTSASCAYPDHKSEVYKNISFTLNGIGKKVEKVFANPLWHLRGDRKANFALLKLAQPIAQVKVKHMTKIMWSSYALEDIGESYLATPAGTPCTTASSKVKKTDTIRHINDDIITVSCTNRGKAAPGSPFYRMVDNLPVIYGVYFSHCTSGSLDRQTSGSCGSRISKQVFKDFCNIAAKEKVALPGCDSKLLGLLNINFPTTVFTKDSYDTIDKTSTNSKGAVFVYHSSASKRHQQLVNEIESIQRRKLVYDKFQMAVVDIAILPFKVTVVPFIEYRAVAGKQYIPYNEAYNFEKFQNFMVEFSRVGAPPKDSTTFLKQAQILKRADIPQGKIPLVQSNKIKGSAGVNLQKIKCNANAYEIDDGKPTRECECLPGYFGDGKANNCQDLTKTLEDNCNYIVNEKGTTHANFLKEIAQTAWCKERKFTFVELKSSSNTKPTSVTVAGKTLTPDYCAEQVEEKAACTSVKIVAPTFADDEPTFPDDEPTFSNEPTYLPVSFSYDFLSNSSDPTLERSRREVMSTKNVPTGNYLSSFLSNLPPGPLTYLPNTHFIYTNHEGRDKSQRFSILYNGDRGIPDFSAYKLTNDQMKKLAAKTLFVNRWTKGDEFITGDLPASILTGTNRLYLGRESKKYPESVKEGQLNPMKIHSYNDDTMKTTHTHLNAYPQFSDFNDGVWKNYEKKIFNYAKTRCQGKTKDSQFHLLTGVSDYELKGIGTSAFLAPTMRWPVAYKDAQPQPYGSPALPVHTTVKPIVQPKSMWTVGCCSWKVGTATKGEAVSVWANNKPKGISKSEVQPDLISLANSLYPGKSCFRFFPANPECTKPSNHYTLS